ncbi:MAG TPA: 23S rRNA (adenine(2503)-C(2))-methyltransferase RlmN [Candidatus Dormibacteraeota bacterium]|nr:23S rRNA (adenine(2503)-C(2))-methyltransferase RlmN [Candidatus Dormibacteraeota bacterium]
MNVQQGRRRPFSSLEPHQVRAWARDLKLPAYRADQLLARFYRSSAGSFAEITELPADVREALEAEFIFSTVENAHTAVADNGETLKELYRLPDKELVECVCMHYPRTAASSERTTLCLSTQVGCAVRCPFCATGLGGLRRNMVAAEVIDQVLAVNRGRLREGGRVSHLVYMGMGEPLHNVEATLTSVRRFTDPEALGLGVRRVTVSTSGVVPGIDELAAKGRGVNLAVSLHAPNDRLRDRLVPLNRKWPVSLVVAAADRYASATHRRISYEYVMLGGINDSPALADDLGGLLHGHLAHVNLIPYNAIPGDPFKGATSEAIAEFRRRVRDHGVECTVRDTRGRDIAAACGQLRAEAEVVHGAI